MHQEVREWVSYVKTILPDFFKGKTVLDVGALDINGNNRGYFTDCKYTGIDIGPGPNVDEVSICHKYDKPNSSFEVVMSTDSLEHDMYWGLTLKKMYDLTKPGGLMLFTCATTGRSEHGTVKYDQAASPHTLKIDQWSSYYSNLTEQNIRSALPVDTAFYRYEFSVIVGSLKDWGKDLRFWGIKPI